MLSSEEKKTFGESVTYFKPYCMALDLAGLSPLELIQLSRVHSLTSCVSDQAPYICV